MKSRNAAPRVAVLLLLLGAVCIGLHVHARYRAQLARGDSIWRLAYEVGFEADSPGAKVHVSLPLDTRHARVFRQQLIQSGMRTEPLRPASCDCREVAAVTQRAGTHRLRAEFDLHLSPRAGWRPHGPDNHLTAQARAACLQSEEAIQLASPAVADALDRLGRSAMAKTEVVERLFEYCLVEIGPGGDDAPQDAAGALEAGIAGPLGRARAMIALCRACKVPARLVAGFELKRDLSARPHVWVEVLANGHWEPYDPENGFARELPRNFVPVRRGGTQIVRAVGASRLRVTNSVVRLPPPPGVIGTDKPRLVDVVDLTRLPLDMHEVLSLILLLPFGALVTSILRTVVGVPTFGTFTPALLALSFVYADWRTGVVVFAAVLALGLANRAMLDRLKLLLVPRLSIVLTLVVLAMVLAVSTLDHFGFTPGPEAVLLPMVILTMMVERFYLTTEEDGMRFAGQLLLGTLLVAFACYLVLSWRQMGRTVLVYPEIHFLTVAALIVIGRYTGYRLTELWRFRSLADAGPMEGWTQP